jgi:hypothetical protein
MGDRAMNEEYLRKAHKVIAEQHGETYTNTVEAVTCLAIAWSAVEACKEFDHARLRSALKMYKEVFDNCMDVLVQETLVSRFPEIKKEEQASHSDAFSSAFRSSLGEDHS